MVEISTVLVIGDLHIGKKTVSYNSNVYKKRLGILLRKVLEYKNGINKSFRMPDIHLFLVGDIIDGEGIYKGQGYETDLTVDEAIDVFIDTFDWFVSGLLDRYRKVYIHTVYGNHGRGSWIGKSNWEQILYKRLRDLYRHSRDVEVDVGDWYNVVNIRGWKYLLVHGEQIRMYQNIPLYGIIQKAMRWYSGGIDEQFDVVVLGHFHTFARMEWNDISILINGTFVTDDEYTMRMGLKSQNKFWMFGVSKKDKMLWAYDIDVGED